MPPKGDRVVTPLTALSFLTTSELSNLLQIPTRTLEHWRSQKKGPKYFRLENGRVRYRGDGISSWLDGQLVETNGTHPRRRKRVA